MTDHNFDGIRVSAGSQSDKAIERSFKYIMPTPYSNCEINNESPKVSDSDLYNLIANSSYEYTQKLCIVQCFQKLAVHPKQLYFKGIRMKYKFSDRLTINEQKKNLGKFL